MLPHFLKVDLTDFIIQTGNHKSNTLFYLYQFWGKEMAVLPESHNHAIHALLDLPCASNDEKTWKF